LGKNGYITNIHDKRFYKSLIIFLIFISYKIFIEKKIMIYFKHIQELVDKNGVKISGPEGSIDNDDIKSTSNSTTDDFIKTSRQATSNFLYRRFWGESEDEVKKSPENPNKISKEKMKSMLEDIFSNKVIDKDLVMRGINDLNTIPDLNSLEKNNPIIVKKVQLLKDIINNNLSGNDIAIIVNYLIKDVNDISYEYKKMLKQNIK
jgi:hypothetical protein